MSGDSMSNDDLYMTTKTEEDVEITIPLLPPYNVILYNDDQHSMEFVIDVLQKALGYHEQRSFQLMMQAHETGRAIVWTGSKEVAELKLEQILTFHEVRAGGKNLGPLGVCIEPAPG